MIETLQEFVNSRGMRMRVDRQAGVIRGAKILGTESRNGRTYLPEAISRAAGLYENAKVNVNHPKGSPGGPRDYQDRIGSIRDVRVRAGEGLFADFHFNPKHALAEQLAWDAEHAPENVGFSHNVQARTSRRGEQVVVEAITKVQSVDLVADPATTGGLFESRQRDDDSEATAPVARLSLDDLKRDYPELVEAIRRERDTELDELRAEVERLTARETAHQKRVLVRRLLREFELPDPETGDARAESVVGRRFLDSVLAAPDEETMRDLIEERARLVKSLGRAPWSTDASGARPLARDRHLLDPAGRFDARAFVEAIT